jgi:type II secretory pathway component PulM
MRPPVSVLDHLRRPGWSRRALFALGLLLVLAIVVRVPLDPIAAHFTQYSPGW